MTAIGTVISLFDYSGNAVRDWAGAGYDCYCLDICHDAPRVERVGRGQITYLPADLNFDASGWAVASRLAASPTGHKVLFAWPPCDDLAVSGNRHKAGKRAADPLFEWRAARRATRSAALARKYGFAWMVENPIGALSRLWRRPDRVWHPYHFGGYLPPEEEHPVWPRTSRRVMPTQNRRGHGSAGGSVSPRRVLLRQRCFAALPVPGA